MLTPPRLISGSNHLLQFLVCRFSSDVNDWFETNRFAIFRNIDFGFSAPLMLLTLSILFKAPADVLNMTYIWCFQALPQLWVIFLVPQSGTSSDPPPPFRCGYSAEVIKQMELQKDPPTDRFSYGRPILYSAVALYVLPWGILFTLFYIAGYMDVETTVLFEVPGGAEEEEEPAEPPLQVFFFLFWLFGSFSRFSPLPVAVSTATENTS